MKKKLSKPKAQPKAAKKPAKAAKPRTRTRPAAQPLPGMEQARNTKLDKLCESIGEVRDGLATLRGHEKEDVQAALTEMIRGDVGSYRHAGVELVRVAGEEKLRVRTTGEDASAMVASDAEPNGDGEA